MRIGAHHRIGICLNSVAGRHGANHARKIFEIYLVADSRVWRHYLEIVKCGLTPAQKCISLHVALKFQLRVEPESIDAAKIIDLHGMVDDQLGGEQRIDALGISAHALHRFAHCSQIDDCRHTSKILQQHPRGHEGNFFFSRSGTPIGQRLDVRGVNESVVFAAQKIFKQNAQRKRELAQIRDPIFLERFQPMYFETLRSNAQRVTRAKRISCGDGHPRGPFTVAQPSMITEIELRRGRLYW